MIIQFLCLQQQAFLQCIDFDQRAILTFFLNCTETETMTMASEASIPHPTNIFTYNAVTKDAIPRNVTHVKVDPSVKEIHAWAFKDCESLVEVEFSEGLEVIGIKAFSYCQNLKYINKLPSTLKEIHSNAFRRCESLVEVEFSEGLERIGRRAFKTCTNLKHINKLPSTLKEIGDDAFWRCESLDSIEFPEGLQVIGASAFVFCGALKKIKIPSAHVVIKSGAFQACSGLDSVELPEGLQEIGKSWFSGCPSLTTVNVPSSVIEIQHSAFEYCTSLASLGLPEGLQSIGLGSFSSCESLATLHIPSTVCKMGTRVFWNCTGLRSITLPDTLEIIEARMFYGCYSLTHIEIPPKVTKIGSDAFHYCEGLKHLRIPSSVVEIGTSAFACCQQLTSVHLLGNLRTIEEGTFYECSSLTHARIPSSVTRIERGAFADCTRLISLELPEGLEMIDGDAEYDSEYDSDDIEDFPNIYDCYSLVNLVVPSEQRFQQIDVYYDDQFMEGLKLRHVASSFTDLVSKLQHRFDDLPVHRLCYYQSYYPLTEAMENMRRSMDADPAAGNKMDAFGMTPFHILALSQTPNHSLFQALMKVYKVDIILTRDKFGSTPIDYLCMNQTQASALLIGSLLPTIFAERVRWLGLLRWKSNIVNAMDEALAVEWASRKREIRLLYFKLATYERLESVSLLELALWKVKFDSFKAAYDTDHERGEECRSKRPRLDRSHLYGVDRQSCRIKSGADVVISNVLPFLDKVCREDYIAPEPSFEVRSSSS
jgi:hypothetical protein